MIETENAMALYAEFRALNPNSQEVYNPTLPNLQRWHWHINEAKFRPQYEKILPGEISSADRRFISARRFKSFSQLPEYMQARFLELAAMFMGREVWACGSRVNGTWIEKDSLPEVARMREGLGKAPKIESDYDVYFPLKPDEDRGEILSRLPKWADLLPHGVPPDEKILIPMWDWAKLPKSEHAAAIEMYEGQRWGALMQLHNKYGLSPQTLCCDDKPVRKWFAWAINNEIIKK